MAVCFGKGTAYGQSVAPNESLLSKAHELLSTQPDEAIKIAEYLLKANPSDVQKAKLNLLLAESYWVKGDYNNSVITIFEAGKHADNAGEDEKIKILLHKSRLFRALYLDSQSKRYLEEATGKVAGLKSKEEQDFFGAKILMGHSDMYLERQGYQKASELLQEGDKRYKLAFDKSASLQQDFYIAKARAFVGLTQLDSANYYLKQAQSQKFLKNKEVNNFLNRITILKEQGLVYFQEKEHGKAIEALHESMLLATKIKNEALLATIYKQLGINYLAINDKKNYQLFDNNFFKAHSNVEELGQDAVNTAYNLISLEQETDFQKAKSRYVDYFYIAIGLLFLVIIIGFLLWLKYYMKKKRLKEIISYLEISAHNPAKLQTEKKETNKKIAIPAETEQVILAKLKRFENSTRYTNKEMSLAVLAGQFDTNTKYLSEIINKHYQDNFNTYINKLRINFIIGRLKEDPNYMHYKISYLAEKSGFSSHSSFATVFKSITGIAPGTFIELLKAETEAIEHEKINSHA